MARSNLLTYWLSRFLVVFTVAAYVLILGLLFREDLRVGTLGDALALKRREIDAQLVQNSRDIQRFDKRRNDGMLEVLRDERQALNAQGVHVTREVAAWEIQRKLWSGVYWSSFAFAHIIVLPLLLWAIGAAFADDIHSHRGRRTPATGRPRKRSPRPRSATKVPRLVEDSGA